MQQNPLINIGAKVHHYGRCGRLKALTHQFKKGVPVMAYVLDKNGQPLMPTDRHQQVRTDVTVRPGQSNQKGVRLHNTTEFMIPDIKHRKFLLWLMPEANISEYRQPTKSKCYMEADVELRNDIVNLLSSDGNVAVET